MGKYLHQSLLSAKGISIPTKGEKFQMRFGFALSALFMLIGSVASAQVLVTASAGTATGNYTTLQIAIDSINSGAHQGAVTIALPAAGSESNTTGAPITLNGSGIGAASYTSVAISAASGYTVNAGTSGAGTPASAVLDGIFALNGADNVSITGVTFTDGNALNPATMEYGVGMFKAGASNGCQNNTITGCTFNMKSVNNALGTLPVPDGATGILAINATMAASTTAITTLSAAGTNSNNTISGCITNGGNTGIAFMGFAAGALSLADANNTIGGATSANGNTVRDFGGAAGATSPAVGIRVLNGWDFLVRNNTVNNNTGLGANHITQIRGIYTQTQPLASGTVSNNTVTIKNGATGAGVSCIENAMAPGATIAAGPLGTTINLNNNTITGCTVFAGTTAPWYGIWNNATCPATININGNTVVGNTSAAASGATWMISEIQGVGHNLTATNMNNNVIGSASTVGMAFNGTAAYTGVYYGLTVQRTNTSTNAVSPDLNWNYNVCENAISHAVTSTGTIYHFYTGTSIPVTTSGSTAFNKVARVVGNQIKNVTINHTGTNYGMYFYNVGGHVSVNIDSNLVDGYRKTTAAATGSTYMIYTLGYYSAPNTPISYNYNRVINCSMSTTGTSLVYCQYNYFYNSGAYGRLTYTNNVSNDNFINGTGSFYGLLAAGFGDGIPALGSIMSDNQVRRNKSAGGQFLFYATTPQTGSLPLTISNNIIDQDTSTGASSSVFGIYTFPSAGGYNITRNNVSRLVSTGTTLPLITGIYSSASGPVVQISNNEVGDFRFSPLCAPALNRYIGMQLLGSSPYNVRYNTVRLDSANFRPAQAHGATGIIWGATAASLLNLQNNIININVLSFGTTSQVSALRRNSVGTAGVAPPISGSTTLSNFNANNNIYYIPADTNNFYFVQGTSVAALTNGFKPYDAAGASGLAIPASNIVVDTNFNSSCGAYKKFLGAPRETATFTENNLTQSLSNPSAWVPTGSSFAESGAVAITTPTAITIDYSSVTRATTPDIGALEFAGVINDQAGPAISFTSIPNSICDNNPNLAVTITDPSGVLSSGAGAKPRMYFKKSTEANVLLGNTNLDNGWKYVDASNSSSPFLFTMPYTLLTGGGVVPGEIIQYFIVAQDQAATNNFGSSAVAFPSTFCPDTTELPAVAFPAINTNSYTILPQPTAVTAVATPSTLCGSGTATLTLSGGTFGGATFQWQVLNAGGSYINVPGAVADSFVTPVTTTSTFRCQIFCNGVPITPGSPSVSATVNVYSTNITGTTPATRCGTGAVCLGATANSGSSVVWYNSATSSTPADTVVGTGSPYCPTVSATTTFYAAAQSPLGAHTMGLPAAPVYYSTINTATWAEIFEVQNPAGAWVDSVDMYFNNTAAANVQLNVYNGGGTTLLHTGPLVSVSVAAAFTTAGVASPANRRTVPVGKFLPPGIYRMSLNAATTATPWYNFLSGGFAYPYNTATPNIARVTGGATSLTGASTPSYYNWFYKFYLRAACESSPRTAVTATVTAPPSVTATSSALSTVCVNSTQTLTATSSNAGYTYAWVPGALTGASPIVTMAGSTVYTVTATDNSGGSFDGCASVATVSITTFAPPPLFSLNTPNTSVCSGGSATITAVDSGSLVSQVMPSGYCTSAATSTADEEVLGFSFAGQIATTSTCASTGGPASNGLPASTLSLYSNYTALTPALVARGSTQPFSVTLGYCGTFAYSNVARILLDYNRNGVFTDPGEVVWTKAAGAVTLTGQTFTGNITIPVNASLGKTLLRVQYFETGYPTGNIGCGTNTWGEVEDYPVVIGYSNSPAASYAWSSTPSTTFTPSNTAVVTAGPISATTVFTCVATDANGCTAAQTTTVNVGPMVCNAIISSSAISCACAPVTLSASATGGGAPYIYEWTNAAGVLIGTNPNVVVSPCSTEVFSVKIKSGDPSCTDSCIQTITQTVAAPIAMTFANTAGGPIQICGNNQSNVSVTANGAVTYSIAGIPAPTPATGAGPFVFNNITTTTYTVTGTNASGCTNTATLVVTYRKKDTIEIKPLPGPNVCVGSTVTLSVSDTVAGPDNAQQVYCAPSHSIAGPCISNVVFNSINNASGATCALPSYTSYAGSVQTLLVKGQTSNLTMDISPTGFGAAYIDYNRDGDFADAGEYTVVVVSNNTATIPMTIPNTAKEGLTRLRLRSSSTNIANVDSCSNLPDGETEDYLVRIIRTQTPITSVTWSSAGTNNAGVTFTTNTSNPTTAGGYTGSILNPNQSVFVATVTDANGCTNQTTVGINTAPLSAGTISANALSRCSGQLLQLIANPVGGGQPYTYSWSGPGGVTGTGAVLSVFPVNTGSVAVTNVYTLDISDACSPSGTASTTISIIVNPLPVITPTIGNQPLCVNGTSNMLITLNSGVGGAVVPGTSVISPTAFWSPSAGAGPFSWTPGLSSVYTVTSTVSATGCSATTSISMVYSPPFSVTATANPTGIGPCGGTVTFTAKDTVTGPQTFCATNTYGISSATSTADDDLWRVQINGTTLNNASTCTTVACPAVNGLPASAASLYSNYTCLPATTLYTNTTYTGSFDLSNCSTFGYSMGQAVFIDLNRNCAWDLPAERVFGSTGTNAGGVTPAFTTVPWSFTMPSSASPGVTLMRVVVIESQAGTGISPSTTYTWGETEDYLVNIVSIGSACSVTNYTWTYTDSLSVVQVAGTGKTLSFSPPSLPLSQIYTVTATNSCGCTGTGTVAVTIGPVNCGVATAWKDTVCYGQCDTITANPTSGGTPYTYAWSGPGITGVSNAKKLTVCTNAPTAVLDSATYTVIVTDACGATCSSTKKIYLRPQLALAISPNGTDTLCATGNKVLAALPTTYTAYAWSPALGVVGATNTASITVSPLQHTNYVVTATDVFGCSTTASDSITYSPPMYNTVTATPPVLGSCGGTVCMTIVDSSVVMGPQTLCSPAPGYGISSATSNFDDEIARFQINGTALNQVSGCGVTGGPAVNGLPASVVNQYSNYTGTVPAPMLFAGNSYTGSMDLTNCSGFAYSMGQAIFIDWNRNCAWDLPAERMYSSTGTNAGGVSPGVTTVPYSFTIPTTATAGVTLMRVIVVESTSGTAIQPNNTYTWGETEDYLVNIMSGTPPVITYVNTWSGGNLTANTPGITVCDSINANTTYSVTATNNFGCTSVNSVTIVVAPLVCGPITTPADTVCSATNFTLSTVPLGGGVITSYVWAGPGITTSSNTGTQIVSDTNLTTSVVSNTYTVTLTDACGSTCQSTRIVAIRPGPVPTIVAAPLIYCGITNGTLTASVSNSGGAATTGISWTPAGQCTPSNGNLTTAATLPPGGPFCVTVTDANGCTASSCTTLTYSAPFTVGATANPSNIGACSTLVTLTALPSTVSAVYCVPTFGTNQYDDVVDFGVGNSLANYNIINNASTCGTTGGGAANGLPASVLNQYSNYTNLPASTTVMTKGTKYHFKYSIDTCINANGTNYAYAARVFIDLNRDGDFIDLGEDVYTPATFTGGGHTIVDSFTINPAAIVNGGVTVMRIVANSTTTPNAITPCGAFFSGEAEDYLVTVTDTTLSYAWTQSVGGGLVATTGALVTANPTGQAAYTYTVTATNGSGCTTSSVVTVTSNPFSLDSVIVRAKTPALAICEGLCDTLKVYATGGTAPVAITVTPTAGVTPVGVAFPTWFKACPAVTTTYTVTTTDACGTSATTSVTINIRTKPVITWPGGLDSAVSCVSPGSLTIPSPIALSCVSSTWSPAGPPGTFTFNAPSVYTYTCTDGFGCTNTSTFKVIVNYAHNIVTTATPANACYGGTATVSFTDTQLALGPQAFCATNSYGPSQASSTADDEIARFSITGTSLNNVSGCGVTGGPAANGLPASIQNRYSNYTSLPATNLYAGTVYNGTMDLTNCSAFAYSMGQAIFIDLNRNCQWDLPAERVFGSVGTNSGAVSPASTTVPFTFTVPLTATAGVTLMRVVVIESNVGTGISPSAGYTWGETEDYLVNLAANQPASLSSWYWTNGVDTVNNSNPSVLGPLTGTSVYTLTVVGAGGCTYTSTKTITVNPQIVITDTSSNPTCYGFANGSITATATGGSGPLTMSIEPNVAATGSTFANLAIGTYTVSFTDTLGCADSVITTITQPDSLNTTVSFANALACFGDSTGTMYVSVIGGTPYSGTPNYIVSWTDGLGNTLPDSVSVNGDTIYNLSAGSYQAIVYDSLSCVQVKPFIISQPSAPVSILGAVDSNVNCKGGSNGGVTVVGAGGTPSYKYSVDAGPYTNTTGVFTGLAAGVHTLSVQDSTGICNASMLLTVTEPDSLIIVAYAAPALPCYGDTASITPIITGGSPAYAYSWSTGATTSVLSGVGAGTYTLNITDAKGCTSASSYSYTQPDSISVTAIAVTDVTCFGLSNGAVAITPAGGMLNGGTYLITPAQTGLAAGVYTFTITDGNSCTFSVVDTVAQPALLVVDSVVVTPTLCVGSGNGTATIYAQGGTAVYNYAWQGKPLNNTSTVTDYAAGTYTVVITDANMCSTNAAFAIGSPNALAVSTTLVNDASCFGATDGKAYAIATGGTGTTYTYAWSSGATTDTASGLGVGSYGVIATDANGCTAVDTIVIAEPTLLTIDSVVVDSVGCNGGSNGSATVYASGGTATYTYAWQSNASTTNAASAYAAGTYTVVVTDANQCSTVSSFTIDEPAALAVTTALDSSVTCNGLSNGGASATTTGGTGAVTFAWTPSGGTAAAATGLAAGTYSVVATDANTCTAMATVLLTQPDTIAIALSATPIFCPTDPTVITVAATGGTGAISGVGTFTVTASGTYSYACTDVNGCMAIDSITVTYPDSIAVTSVVVTDAACNGVATGSVAITATGGTVAGAYVITPSTTGLAAGPHTFNIADDNGCSIDTVITIDEPSAVVITIDSFANALCGGGNGLYAVSAAGGTGTVAITINGTAAANPYADYSAVPGIYSIMATDASGCVATSSVNVIASSNTLGVVANASAVSVCGNTSIMLFGSNTSGSTNVVYTWDNGVTDSVAFAIAAGSSFTYIVSGVDTTTGCGEQDTINITSAVASAQLAQASASNAASLAGNSCDLTMQPQGSTIDYIDGSCNLIATVNDALGGNALGAVTACVYVAPAVQVWNSDPYVARTFNIVPQTNGPANVTLYYTHDDILDYNNYLTANGLSSPPAFNYPNAVPMNGDQITNAQITKTSDTLGLGTVTGFYNVTLTYDAANMRWSTTFAIPSFSRFFLHTSANPLSVETITLTGRKDGSTDVLDWTTVNEKDMSHFALVRGASANNMTPIATNIASKGENGTYAGKLKYSFVDQTPLVGHNYYQVQGVSIDGKVNNSDIVDIYWGLDGAQVVIYPNPALNDLHVDINIERPTPAKIRIYDASGRLVKQIETELNKGLNSTVVDLGDIASGVYMIKITDGKVLNYSQQFRKN
jgi:hypothetical protein